MCTTRRGAAASQVSPGPRGGPSHSSAAEQRCSEGVASSPPLSSIPVPLRPSPPSPFAFPPPPPPPFTR